KVIVCLPYPLPVKSAYTSKLRVLLIAVTIALGPIILTFTLSGNPATNSVSFAPLTFNGISITIDFSRSEEHTSELQSRFDLVCRLLLEQKNNNNLST